MIKEKNSIEEIVYNKLKSAILNRVLAPGTQLVENTISKKLNTSRTPIRNAIRKLSSEGLINTIPNKGAFVISPSLEDIVEAYQLRAELECIAIRFCVDKITDKDIEELKKIVKEEYSSILKGNVELYLSKNKDFHAYLSRKSNNKFLIKYINEIIDKIDIYLKLQDKIFNVDLNQVSGNKDHSEIIKLLQKKDIASLELVLRNHINSSLKDLNLDKSLYKPLNEIF